jgi:predicted nuclease with TOPRIM domain
MRARKVIALLIMMLFFTGLICSVGASSTTTVSFRGIGVTVDLTFPEEAHPLENISHNVTITANTALTIQNFTIFIYAPVNSSWQEVKNQTITSFDLWQNQNITSRIGFILPQEANGTLSCFIYVRTDQSADYVSTTFYTTRVSNLTFTEMESLYNEMLANYTTLKAQYETKLNEYNSLSANYSSLFANYTAILSENNNLLDKYNAQVASYESLLNSNNNLSDEYDKLSSNYQSKITDYNTLQADYKTLNSTKNSLQTTYNTLKAAYDGLSQDYINLQDELTGLRDTISSSENALNSDRIVMLIFVAAVAGLVAFIIYIRQKSKEPYVVIRKETVAVKPTKK